MSRFLQAQAAGYQKKALSKSTGAKGRAAANRPAVTTGIGTEHTDAVECDTSCRVKRIRDDDVDALAMEVRGLFETSS